MGKISSLLIILFFIGLHGLVEAASGGETQLFKKGENAFRQKLYESSISYLLDYLEEYGDNGRFSDAALFYMGESFAGLTEEYHATFKMLLDKTETELREMFGEKLYEDLRKESIERNRRMGSVDVESDANQVIFGIKCLYAENLFFQKYGRFNRYRKLDFAWYPPIYTKDEYVKLLKRYPDSEWAVKAFLRLTNIRFELDEKSPINNFALLDYEGFGSFVGLAQNCLEFYKNNKINNGLDAALRRLNLLYPEAGPVDDISELSAAIKAYEEILNILPDGENSKAAAEILRDLRLRMKNK